VALTIDSSENVLANTTSTSVIGNGGFAIKPQTGNGTRVDISNNGEAMLLDGAASGPIIGLYGNGTSVGNISTQGQRLSIGSGDVNLNFNASANSMYPISDPAAGTLSSGIVDLGAALATFKDAYLSGGVYLGGTAGANKLDDFETGSFTPYFTSSGATPSLTYTTQGGTYVKVGNLVTIWIKLRINNISSYGTGNLRVAGLPFTVTDACAETGGSVGLWLSMASATGTEIIQQRSGGQQLFVLQNTTNGAHSVNAMANGGYLRCTTSYTT
jgi:hypothetical protein